MTLEVKNGRFGYGDTQLFEDISFTAEKGDLIAILGPNGAGKTTLLRCITGMLKWKSGGSFIDGVPIKKLSARELWKKLAYVPQAKGTASSATVFETVLLGRNSHIGTFSQPKKEDTDKVGEILERLKISHLADKSCRRISGGELQMSLIARALAAQPQILILDEPESNLDFRNQLIVLETLSQLSAEGITCIFNTHYPEHALGRANKSLILGKDGKGVFGDTARVVTEEGIERAFGVKALISEAETKSRVFRTVTPVSLSDGADTQNERKPCGIAVVSVIANGFSQADRINAILHKYGKYTIGRMGIPYRKGGVSIANVINVTLEAPDEEIASLVGELSAIKGVAVKATCAE